MKTKVSGTILMMSLIYLCFFSVTFANEERVATVLKLKGKVLAKYPGGQSSLLKVEQNVPEGTELFTSDKSFVKLIFSDKSILNLGPSSSMLIQAFSKKDSGIIRLIKGQIRAQVTKDYMDMSDKNASKLYIRTKTAAMGIRGTDFQVNFNPINNNSSLIVFEGKVSMGHIDRAYQDQSFVQKRLEEIVSNNTAVIVKQGEISAVNFNISERPLIPTKLAPKQLDALQENTSGLEEESKGKKQFRDVVPPGLDSASFRKESPEIMKVELENAKGFFNEKTREYKPAAGTIIDLKTVNLLSPPKDAQFDITTKTFVLPENYGKVDDRSGVFKAPKGYEVSNEGKFAEKRKDFTGVNTSVKIDEQAVKDRSGEALPTTVLPPPITMPKDQTNITAPPPPPPPPPVIKDPNLQLPPPVVPLPPPIDTGLEAPKL